jgi:hypothetical protein
LPSELAQLSILLLRPTYTPNKITNDAMKNYSQFKPFTAALLAVAILPLATLRAQVTYELAPSAFTLAMVVKETAPGTFERNPIGGAFITENRQRIPAYENEWETGRITIVPELIPVEREILRPTAFNVEFVAKIVTTRYGNRELIAELNEADPELFDGDTRGWSLVYVYGDPTADPPADPVLVARKGDQVVRLDGILEFDYSGGAFVDNYLETTSLSYRGGELTSAVAAIRGRYNYELATSISFGGNGVSEASLSGLEIGAASYFSYYPDPNKRSEAAFFSVPGATRITNLVGATVGEEPEEGDEFGGFGSLVTGTASIGASRVITKRTPIN